MFFYSALVENTNSREEYQLNVYIKQTLIPQIMIKIRQQLSLLIVKYLILLICMQNKEKILKKAAQFFIIFLAAC